MSSWPLPSFKDACDYIGPMWIMQDTLVLRSTLNFVCNLNIPLAVWHNIFICSVFGRHYSAYLEKAMAPHSSTIAWKMPWTEEPGRLQSMGSLESDKTERLHFHFSLSCTGEGNGNPLQCSCLENPRDGEAWWAAVYGVAQSRTRLKRLSSSSSSSSSSTWIIHIHTNLK